jgi:glycosyltransferase involved in cell wall biosynthesis
VTGATHDAAERHAFSGLVGLDITPLSSGHAIRGVGRYVEGTLDALLSAQPEWCLEHLGLLVAGRQGAARGVRITWRSRRASFRPQDTGWIVAALSDRAVARRAGVRLWHETDPGNPFGPDRARLALVTAYDLIPLLEPAVMARIRPHRRLVYRIYLQRLRNARHILAISQTTAADLRSVLGVSADRIDVVYPAVRAAQFKQADDPVNDRMSPSILFVGVPDPHKRPDLAVAAFASYRRMGGTRRLVFVGHHPPATRLRLRRLVQASELEGEVEFRDRVDDAMLGRLYANGILLALSTREGFGLPPVECLLSGGRVVATPSSIYLETLAAVPVFSLDDSPDAIAQGLLAAEATAPSQRGVRDLAERYAPVSVARNLIRVYESLLG